MEPIKLPPILEELLRKQEEDPDQVMNLHSFMLPTEMNYLREYLHAVETGFQKAFEAFDEETGEVLKAHPESRHEWIMENRSADAFNLAEYFPQHAWQTAFVSIYSTLEDEMIELCGRVGRFLGVKLTVSDLKDKGIFAAKKYLETLCGVPFPTGKRPWQEIQHYNRLRNVVVHARGRLIGAKDPKVIAKYVGGKRKELVTLHNDKLVLTKAFCLEVVDSVEALLRELYENATARMKVYAADRDRLRAAMAAKIEGE
jgi:hypothetical protein